MSKKNKTEITNKQTAIKQYTQKQLLQHNAIDNNGNILDLKFFQDFIATEIKKCQKEMADNETINGVVKDQMLQSYLIGDLEYLQNLAKHSKNFDSLKENIIKPQEVKAKVIMFPRLNLVRIIIQDKIARWLRN